jgi:hypothetical protein
MLSPS